MRIMIIIAADVLIAVISLFGASEFFGLRRFNSFAVPYTDKLIAARVIDPQQREAVLREDRISHAVGLGIALLTAILMSLFLAWPSGLIVAALAFGGAALLLHPDMTETEATRDGYYRLHKAKLEPRRYSEFVQQIPNARDKA